MTWLELPPAEVLPNRAEPYFVPPEHRDVLLAHFEGLAVSVARVDVRQAESLNTVFLGLRNTLSLPSWCGTGWDSLDDAFPVLLETWQFPLVLVVEGLPELIGAQAHLAFDLVLGLSRLSDAFSIEGKQFVVFYIV